MFASDQHIFSHDTRELSLTEHYTGRGVLIYSVPGYEFSWLLYWSSLSNTVLVVLLKGLVRTVFKAMKSHSKNQFISSGFARVNQGSLCKFLELSSTLVNFDMQICTTAKWQTGMMVLTFEWKDSLRIRNRGSL